MKRCNHVFSDFLKYYPGGNANWHLSKCLLIQEHNLQGLFTKNGLDKEVEGRHIILMEDIVDTGNTIESLYNYFENTQRPKSLKVATLLLKPEVYKKISKYIM